MLIDSLKTALADAFVFSLKTQFYHWNIEGPNFIQYHEFTGELYKEVYDSVDTLAELVRTLDVYAPGTLDRFKELSTITESENIIPAIEMLNNLKVDNDLLRASLIQAYMDAEEEGEIGVSNYLQGRIQAHDKHAWMLRAITK